MEKYILLFIGCFLFATQSEGQSYAFGLKGGLTVGLQKWDRSSFSSRDPLYQYHGLAFIETAEEDNRFALFAQAGYHVKGSAIRSFAGVVSTPTGLRDVPARTTPFKFKNVSLTLGGKQKYDFNNNKVYYLFGIRGDYNVGTQLRPEWLTESYSSFIYYPFEEFVRKFTYGMTIGGGIELPLTELMGAVIELTVSPDFARQYYQPSIPNVINPNPNSSQNTITLPERQIVNTVVELTVGFRFLHKIEYID